MHLFDFSGQREIFAFVFPENKFKIRVCNNSIIAFYFGNKTLKIGESLYQKNIYLKLFPCRILIYK